MIGKIIVVTHKDYTMPLDSIYFPVCVGSGISALEDRFQPDNIGENISAKNATYCELTAIYWAWKNLKKLDYVGVSHYRRHFSSNKGATRVEQAISGNELETLMKSLDDRALIATPKRVYPISIEKHYIHSLKGYEEIHRKDIRRLREAIHIYSPEYDDCADKVLKGHSAHMLNMFIMSADNFDKYCSWLFPVIDRVVALSTDRQDQRRYAGALSEFCLDIWAKKNNLEIKELHLLETEKSSWLMRAFYYLKRKHVL